MNQNEAGVIRWAVRHPLILKVIVFIGLLSVYIFPPEWAIAANMENASANMIWLWKL
ncbi:hypothetical protein D8I24_5478 (plasmid) [Cupriavidus necator H850]|uniref:hypothetical protein n=1 Tax=Cupriavidus necator TaxID=106590 RepID=UPI00129E57B3|nr:hypothetical protein [Cupriavidus necator]KAI3599120.1 hypothetical protein D8I24_5478 [Cupriavidus necator H850]